MENIKDTEYNFTLVLRQMYTETIFREKLESVGASYYQAMQCIDFKVDESAPVDSHAVTPTFTNQRTKAILKLKSKYLIGADGGRSFVRRHADIPFEGDTSEDKWVRIDGIVDTDMPLNRSYGAIESKTHGNVLWAPLDHGATRIGYAYSDVISAKYPEGVTQDVAEKEALESMKPFNINFKGIHWWTLYTIGQRIAKTFSTKNRIFLCGDAAHTHSSGAAQGLNTGIHDAVNLGWKLAFQIRGLVQPGVLETYSPERMTAVQKLINYDKDISILMSHKWPSWYEGDKAADPYLLLGEIFEQAASFNTGLGISYPANMVNQAAKVELAVVSGSRPPDVHFMAPGTNQEVRFQRITYNIAKFWVVVCTGNVGSTRISLLALKAYLASTQGKTLTTHRAVEFLTICPTIGCSPYEAMGMKPFGDLYFDPSDVAHSRFGVNETKGSIIILRPDGLVGCSGPLERIWVKDYFSTVLT